MIPKKNLIPWPPIIYSKSVPTWIRLRDAIITLAAWGLLIIILHDFWRLIYDYLTDPIFQLSEEQSPDWAEIWIRISHFVYIAVGLIIWIVGLGLMRKKIIQHTRYIHTLPPKVEMQELALHFGHPPIEIEGWHALRAVNVYVDEKSGIKKIEKCDED